MAEAVQAALVGRSRKKLKIYDHEFNVKPMEILQRRENYLRVRGHISHHLTWRKDDQVYYLIEVENGTLKPIEAVDITRGGLALFAGPAASIISAYYGVPIPPDLAEKVSRDLGRVAKAPGSRWSTPSSARSPWHSSIRSSRVFDPARAPSDRADRPGRRHAAGRGAEPGPVDQSASGRYRFIYQGDGNLVLYDGGTPLWASNTDGKPVGVCIMQDDGNLVIYARGGQPIWASDTWQHPGSRLSCRTTETW